jgi:hypothetical protein
MEERVRMLGGQIALTSQQDQGARLYFELSRTSNKAVPRDTMLPSSGA